MGFESLKFPFRKKSDKEQSLMMRKIKQDSGNKERHKKQEDEEIDLDRRRFVKNTAMAGAGLLVAAGTPLVTKKGYDLVKNCFDSGDEDIKPSEEQIKIEQDDENAIKNVIKKEAEKKPIRSEDVKLHEREDLAEALSFGKEKKVVFDKEFMENIEKHWLKRYGLGGNLHESLRIGFKRMQPWMDLLKKHFSKTEHFFIVDKKNRKFILNSEEVKELENFVYLTIPESHFQIEARSRAGAQGPYQFMKRTAKKAKLSMGGGIDERYDPELSAEACAANLVYLYKQCEDWDLALCGYNGGFIWKYFSKERNIKKRTYEGFIEFVQEEVNEKRELIKNDKEYVYKVSNGDTLSKIARRFGLTVEEIKKYNGFKNDIIHKKQKIKIPLKDFKQRRQVFNFLIKKNGLSENLNYPAKFNAVHKIIQSGAVDDLVSMKSLKFKNNPIPEKIIKNYKVVAGDNFFRIGRKFKISVKFLMKINNRTSSDIKIGELLKIVKTKDINLSDLAENKKELKVLQALNPAIRSVESPLPKGYKIRTIS